MKNKKFLVKKSSICGVLFLYLLIMDSSFPFGVLGLNQTVFYWTKFIFAMVVVAYNIFIHKKCKNKEIKYISKKIKIMLLTPWFAMIGYSAILWMIEGTSTPFVTRGISNFISGILPVFLGCSLVEIYGDRILRLSLISICLMAITNYCAGFILNGPSFFVQLFNIACEETRYRQYKELHEIAYIAGLFLIYYLIKYKDIKINKIWIAMSGVCFFFAWKRIGIAGLLLAFLFYIILKKLNKNAKKFNILGCGMIAIVLSLLYVYISSSDALAILLQYYGIDMMGRNVLYSYFSKFCSFDLTFMGNGIGFVSRQFTYSTSTDVGAMSVLKQGLHNDLFSVFLEIGMIGYILWLYYWLISIPKKMSKTYGVQSALEYFALIIFMFVTYTTDNTLRYFCFQMNFTMLLIVICYDELIKSNFHYTKFVKSGSMLQN